MRLAFLFPGQGAQHVGMGRALAAAFAPARETFEAADRALGFALSRVCWEGPEDELRKTVHAQPALLTHSVAAWRLADAAGLKPEWVAGHSLGEYSACVAAGALDFEDAVRLVHRRGALMYQAGLDHPAPWRPSSGSRAADVEAVCAEAAVAGVVRAANLNAPGQVVISGEVRGGRAGLRPRQGERRPARHPARGERRVPLAADGARRPPDWPPRSTR